MRRAGGSNTPKKKKRKKKEKKGGGGDKSLCLPFDGTLEALVTSQEKDWLVSLSKIAGRSALPL